MILACHNLRERPRTSLNSRTDLRASLEMRLLLHLEKELKHPRGKTGVGIGWIRREKDSLSPSIRRSFDAGQTRALFCCKTSRGCK